MNTHINSESTQLRQELNTLRMEFLDKYPEACAIMEEMDRIEMEKTSLQIRESELRHKIQSLFEESPLNMDAYTRLQEEKKMTAARLYVLQKMHSALVQARRELPEDCKRLSDQILQTRMRLSSTRF